MSDKPPYIFHYTPEAYFNSLDPNEGYLPAGFAGEGFIHTTEGAANVLNTVNSHYRHDPQPFLVLYIERARITSPVRYDDPAQIYPHIYGPLNRDAIVRVLPAPRDETGTFLSVTEFDQLPPEGNATL